MDKPKSIRVFGSTGSAAAFAIRDFLHRSQIAFKWIEVPNAAAIHEVHGIVCPSHLKLPICVLEDGTCLENPTITEIVQHIGWFVEPKQMEYDLAIYGAGPAGLSAAVYAASEGLRTVVLERSAVGGQAGTSSKIENYLGFPQGITGAELADRAREQACRFGAEILMVREGLGADFSGDKLLGFLADGSVISASASICATGIAYRRLGLENEDRFIGCGVYYGAGSSEAELCTSQDVFVVGGGNSAGQAAMHFARFARKVTILVRGASLRNTLSEYLVERVTTAPNIEVQTHSRVVALQGDSCLRQIIVHRTGQRPQTFPTGWLFVCAGGEPRTAWALQAGLRLDPDGYILTGPDLLKDGRMEAPWPLARPPYYLETNVPGMFAAGDVRHGSVKRCASAVGEGAMAVTFAHRFLAERMGNQSNSATHNWPSL